MLTKGLLHICISEGEEEEKDPTCGSHWPGKAEPCAASKGKVRREGLPSSLTSPAGGLPLHLLPAQSRREADPGGLPGSRRCSHRALLHRSFSNSLTQPQQGTPISQGPAVPRLPASASKDASDPITAWMCTSCGRGQGFMKDAAGETQPDTAG